MIWSKYNFLFQSKKNGYLLYNSLSNCFAELDYNAYTFLKELENKTDIKINDTMLLKKLTEMKSIVIDDKDEFYRIKYNTHYLRFSNDFLGLTINPTLHCNFGCKYCFESSKPKKYMTDEIEDGLIGFIQKYDQAKEIDVTWFGGEPLMAFDRIISITERIKRLGKGYSSRIITNGYLLTQKVINSLNDLRIKSIQITIDGLFDKHDNRRSLVSGEGTFNKILNNIDVLKNTIPDFPIAIRVNIDEKNTEDYIDIYKFFTHRYNNNNIYVTPGFVENINGCSKTDCFANRKRKIEFIVDQYNKFGLNVLGFYPNNSRYECPIRNPNNLVIGPEGELYKCYNDVGDQNMIIGSIVKGKIINENLLTRYYVAGDPFDTKECVGCFHLPTCGGGCPYTRIKNEYEGLDNDTCDYIKDNMEEFLEIHYSQKQLSII